MKEEKEDTIQNNPMLDAFDLATDPQAKIAYLTALEAAVVKKPRIAILGRAAALNGFEDDDQGVRNAAASALLKMFELRPSLFTPRIMPRIVEAYVERRGDDGSMQKLIHPLREDAVQAGAMVDAAIASTRTKDEGMRGSAFELLAMTDNAHPTKFSDRILPVAVDLLSDSEKGIQLNAIACVETIILKLPALAGARALKKLDVLARTAADPAVREQAAEVVAGFKAQHPAQWDKRGPNRPIESFTQRLAALAK